ncbi:hypothetical protein [Carboxylicivirga sp. RSCT41]|uniref:hypothetical protein n=1 Tax=Carboxylicivirga agarovorans TaxID=3417570 RepID=UPI003D3290FA
MRKLVLLIQCVCLYGLVNLNAQNVSVSPSRLSFNEAPGGFKSQRIRITNNGSVTQTFTITFNNFCSEGNKGKTQLIKDSDYKHGCAQWLSASPALIELAPGAMRDVEITLQLPDRPSVNGVRWAVANVLLSNGNRPDNTISANEKSRHLNRLLIHIFQTSPAVLYKDASITRFFHKGANANNQQELVLELENTGETILDCNSYLDVVSLQTGESSHIQTTPVTVLPGANRAISFHLPSSLISGKYSILGIVEYGNENELTGAELEIEIK